MPATVILIPSGGTIGTTLGATAQISSIAIHQTIKQVVGLVPLIPCAYSDCRENVPQASCYFNPVFGNIISGQPVLESTYENDWNTFLIDYPKPTGSTAGVFWSLERADNRGYFTASSDEMWNWEEITVLGDDSNGIRYGLGSIPSHPSYDGYAVNWGQVLNNYGPGFYRVKANVLTVSVKITFSASGAPIPEIQTEVVECATSEPFILRAWNCDLAHGTVKFECWNTGSIGSIDEYYKLFDLCDIHWYDSIRMKGFFGFEKTKYDEVILEYQTGQLDLVRDKALQAFKWDSNYLPKWVHDRFKTYGLMSDTLVVSDYNFNNSDYFIKRKGVKKSGGYDPIYLDTKNFDALNRVRQRTSKVSVEFREDVESVIKNVCCVSKC